MTYINLLILVMTFNKASFKKEIFRPNICTLLLILICILPKTDLNAQCNGAQSLCNKKYTEVAYLTTHNAFNSSEDAFELPNQSFNIATQLEDGVRALMIDVYDEEGVPTVYHSTSILGSAPLSTFLIQIKDFLDANKSEIVTIIFEMYTDAGKIETVFSEAQLMNYLYSHNSSETWPSLQEMINNNTRLVVFTDKNDAFDDQAWYHYIWDYAVETHYSARTWEDLKCDYNRGSEENDLFILNHFITDVSGVIEDAALINANPFFLDRVLYCQQENSKFPNFITVDFYDLGDCKAVVDAVNQVSNEEPLSLESVAVEKSFSIYPNPTKRKLTIQASNSIIDLNQLKIYSSIGQELDWNGKANPFGNSTVELDFGELPNGFYFLNINNEIYKIIVN